MARKYAQGKYKLKNPEKYLGTKEPTYRSGWEFTFCKFCDEHPSIQQWASEAVKIPYRNPLTGKQTVYVPDFFIAYADKSGKKRVELIEVKPSNQALREKATNKHNQAHWIINQAKWDVARQWCKQRGIVFRVITEQDIYYQGKKR